MRAQLNDRAAKVAAFPLIVLALVALIACQGTAGVKGDKGDKGDMGDMGTPGDTGDTGMDGDPGVNALAMIDTGRLVINHDDEAGGPIALGEFFTGGNEPITYEVSAGTGTTIDDDGVITDIGVTLEDISDEEQPLKVEAVAADTTAAFDPKTLMVTATDDDGRTAESSIVVRRNRPPVATTGTIDTLTIGLQDADWASDTNNDFGCAKFNVCTIGSSGVFTDLDRVQNQANSEKLKYTVDSDHVSVTAGDEFGEFVLKGEVATTEAVMVKVKATDEGGHEVETDAFSVNVNAPPAPKGTIGDVQLRIRVLPVTERSLTFRVDPYFEDSNDLVYTEETADDMIASVVMGGDDMNELTVTAIGPGTVKITVTATESTSGADAGIGQSGTQEFEVTVTE